MDTAQFWKGEQGNEYHKRNKGLIAANTALFAKALARTHGITASLEFGAGTGMNIQALHRLFPDIDAIGVDINEDAAKYKHVLHCDVFDFQPPVNEYDLVMTSGLLIHINPNKLEEMYEKLYTSTSKYILLCEYYSPYPTSLSYRGEMGLLWKRDFAGEMMDRYPDLRLVDYGFTYHRDPNFPRDDISFFLMEKL